MNNFFELEKKCKKYHQKRIIKLLFLPLLILIVLLIASFYLFENKTTKTIQKSPKTEPKKVVIKPIHKPQKPQIKDTNKTKKTEPKKDKKLPKEIIPTLKPKIDLNMIDFDKETTKQTPKKTIKDVNKTKQIIENNQTKQVKKEESKNVLIITTKIPSFETSFKLMNLYFQDEDYEKSKEWAIKASKIKPKNEDVWRVYALSLYKLNKKEKAIKVLKTYLQYKNSDKIKQTLKIIEEGR